MRPNPGHRHHLAPRDAHDRKSALAAARDQRIISARAQVEGSGGQLTFSGYSSLTDAPLSASSHYFTIFFQSPKVRTGLLCRKRDFLDQALFLLKRKQAWEKKSWTEKDTWREKRLQRGNKLHTITRRRVCRGNRNRMGMDFSTLRTLINRYVSFYAFNADYKPNQ